MILPLFINIILILRFVRSTSAQETGIQAPPNNVLEMKDNQFAEFLITKLNNLGDCVNISEIFPPEALLSVNNKCIILDKICGMLARKEENEQIKKKNELLMNTCRRIFLSVDLRDKGIRMLFLPFSYYFPELKEENMEPIDYWNNSVRYNYRNAFKLWDRKLQKEEMVKLNLSGYAIGLVGAKLIAESLNDMKNLKTLNLNNNNIEDDGANLIAESLKEMNNLEALYLGGNKLGPDSAKNIAESLKKLRNLKTLNLKWNDIGPAGAAYIAKFLKKLKNLTILNLNNNNIGDAGAKNIAESLGELKNLTTLDLSW